MVAEPESVVYRVGKTFVCGGRELTELVPVAGQEVPGGPSRWRGSGTRNEPLPNGQGASIQFAFFVEAATAAEAFALAPEAYNRATQRAGADLRQQVTRAQLAAPPRIVR